MARAFFSRVESNTSFSSLMANAKHQIESGHKPLDCNIIAEVYLPKEDFDVVLNNISRPIIQYKEHYLSSITSSDGIWQCIEVKCSLDVRSLIIYTAGRTFPLYAAPLFLVDTQQEALPQCLRPHPRGVRGEAEGAHREMKSELAELKEQKSKGQLQIQDPGRKKGKKLKRD